MPFRLRVYVNGEIPPTPYMHAKGLQAIVYQWLNLNNAELAKRIRDSNQSKPICVSPLWSAENDIWELYFDVSVLADWLVEPLLDGVGQHENEFRLGKDIYRISGHEVVLSATWDDLAAYPAFSDFHFHVVSPIAHNSRSECGIRKSVVLPSPELYFGSWLNKWNLCSESAIDDEILSIVKDRMAVSACSGSTASVLLDSGRSHIGFEGKVKFKIISPGQISDDAKRALTALARFSSFCGTGVETMRGMGQTIFLE